MAETKKAARAAGKPKPKAARATAQPTTRVLLMEFEISGLALAKTLPEHQVAALKTQLGVEDDGALDRPFKILVPVGSGQGGPKGVIEENAQAAGYFRAIANDSYNNGFEVVPPDPKAFALKPL
jgi:hypothetical protein